MGGLILNRGVVGSRSGGGPGQGVAGANPCMGGGVLDCLAACMASGVLDRLVGRVGG